MHAERESRTAGRFFPVARWGARAFTLDRVSGALGIGGARKSGICTTGGTWRTLAHGVLAQVPWIPEDRYVITVKLDQPGFAGFEPFAATPQELQNLRATLKTRRGIVAPLEPSSPGLAPARPSISIFRGRSTALLCLASARCGGIQCTGRLRGVQQVRLDPEFLH